MAGVTDFQPYLQRILTDTRHAIRKDLQDFYTPTQAELPLQVQTVLLSKAEQASSSPDLSGVKRERLEVLAGLRKYASQHVLLVGRPGSGKSTALRRLLEEETRRCLAGEEQSESRTLQIPVLVQLRELRSCSTLDLIQKALRTLRLSKEEIEGLLLDQQLLLLFDGLNELPTDDAWQELASFRDEFSEAPMIFTTRELGAGTNLGIEKKLEMMPLTEPLMREFVEKRLPGQSETLLSQMRDRLRELAETPLLLVMLCDVFEYDRKIPKNRGELFRKFAQEYDQIKHRGILTASPGFLDFRDELLQQLAAAMMQGGSHPTEFLLQIERDKAEQLLEQFLTGRVNAPAERAKEWLEDLLEHHLLQLAPNPKHIEFHHQLFQEYYAAEWLLRQLPILSDEQLQYYFLNYLKWTEAIALILGMVDDEAQATRVVELALEVDLMLGARLAGEVKLELQLKTTNLVVSLEVPQALKIELLGRTCSDFVIPHLLPFLSNEDFETRYIVSRAFQRIGSDEVVNALLPVLRNENSSVFLAAIKSLENTPDQRVVSQLLLALKHELPDIRKYAASALGTMGTQIEMEPLLEALEDENSLVRKEAATTLGKIGGEAAVFALTQALEDQGFWVAESAAYALGKIGSRQAVPALLEALKTENSRYLKAVCEGLRQIEHEATVPTILAALDDVQPLIRANAAYAAGELGVQAAVTPLLNHLKDENRWVRVKAISALGTLKVHTAIPALLELLNDKDESIRSNVVSSLGQIPAIEAVPELINTLNDQYWLVRVNAAYAIGKIGTNESIQGTILALKHEDPEVRKSAIISVTPVEVGEKGLVSQLLAALRDDDHGVRTCAAETLGAVDTEETTKGVLLALQDREPFVRRGAIRGLRKIRQENIAEEIFKTLNDEDAWVRQDAAYALAEIACTKLMPKISELLKFDSNPYLASSLYRTQAQCKFYNYSIIQSPSPLEIQLSFSIASATVNISSIGKLAIMSEKANININQQNSTIGVGVAMETSKQEFIQNINSTEQSFEFLLTDYKQFANELQQEYPNATDEAAIQILKIKAQEIKQNQPLRWENFLNLKRLWNGGKKAAIKVGEHFTEQNPWGKGAIAFLEGVMDDME